MTRAAGRPAGVDPAVTRGEILRAARSGFAAKGYGSTTVRTLAQDAGVTQPTVYHHFGSKAGVFAAAYRDADDRLIAVLSAAASDSGMALTDRLEAMVDALDHLHTTDPTIAGMLSVGQIETARSPELAAARREVHGATGLDVPEVLRRIVDDAVRSGELPADADPDGVIALLTAMTLGVAMFTTVIDPSAHGPLLASWRHLVSGRLLPPRR